MNFNIQSKKVFGIILIIIFIPIQLLLFAVLAYSVFTNGGKITQNEISLLFTLGIFFFPLWFGFKLWKVGTVNRSVIPDINDSIIDGTYSSESVIKIQVKIELTEFRKLIFRQSYTSPVLIFIYFIGVFMLLFYLLNGEANWFMLFVLLFILYMPILIYRSATSTYKTTKALHENQVYEFTSENISSTGQSFHYTVQWQALHKVKETKNWFLLYTNKHNAMFIPKNSFVSLSDLDTFRRMAFKTS
jgi:hypothetical protein